MSIHALTALAIFCLTLFLILRKPFALHEAWGTAIGAALMLLCNIVTLRQAAQTIAEGESVLIFLLALMLLSALLDRAGFFEWASVVATRASKGNVETLFRNVFLLGAATTAILSLDTTAIILTPIVVASVQRLKLKAYPFLMVCAFVANTGSLLFPVSNLTNLLFQDAFHFSFLSFTIFMLIPQVVALLLNYWLFKWLFRESIAGSFDVDELPKTESVIPDRPFFIGAFIVLGAVVIGYFVASLNHMHPAFVASAGAFALLLWALKRRQANWSIARDLSWALFPFVVGLFVVVRGIENIGLSDCLSTAMVAVKGAPLLHVTSIACATALGSNLVNNIPMALLSIAALKHGHCNLLDQYAALVGCNLGPNLTVTGSLATMLVITSARKKGEAVTAMDFLRVGIVATPVLVVGTAVTVYLVSVGQK